MALLFAATTAAAAQTLDIYFIDVEGGQSTLIVTPEKQALLIDTGFPGIGKTQGPPGDPRVARDANRILAAARDAGVKQIDYLLITHFHDDHDGGVVELSQLLPINTFIDHGRPAPNVDESVPGSMAAFNRYAAVRAKGRHLEPKPGDQLPLKGITATVVSTAGATLSRPLSGATGRNSACGRTGMLAHEPIENPRSTGVLVQFGKFRFLDVGDLTGAPLFALACPDDMIGPVDVYLVAHHGGVDSPVPATFAAFKPRVSIMNNGVSKGGARETYTFLHRTREASDVWQLHRSKAAGKRNFADDRIANLNASTAYWIKLTAAADGSFTVMNGRTGQATNYPARRQD